MNSDWLDEVLRAITDAIQWGSEEAKKYVHNLITNKGSDSAVSDSSSTSGGVTPPVVTDSEVDSVSGEGTTTDNDSGTGEGSQTA